MSADSAYRHRIVGHGEAAPTELTANPLNWRQHPMHQRQALRELLGRVGWVQQVVVNRTTGNLVDGHLRVALALEDAEPTVPVVYVELTPEEEHLVLASLDPVGALAVPEVEGLRELVASLDVDGELAGVLEDLVGKYTQGDPGMAPGDAATEQDFWPVIRLQVSHETAQRFAAWWGALDGDNDDQRLSALLDDVRLPA